MARTANFRIGEALRVGVDAFLQRPFAVILGSFLSYASCSSGGSAGSGFSSDVDMSQVDADMVVAALLAAGAVAAVGGCVELLLFFVRSFGITGWLRFVKARTADEDPEAGVLLTGSDRFVQVVLWRILWVVVVTAGGFMLGAPGVILGGVVGLAVDPTAGLVLGAVVAAPMVLVGMWWLTSRLLLGDVLVSLEGASPVTALYGTWSLTKGATLDAMLFTLVMWLVGLGALVAGFLLCCGVGMIITLPMWCAVYDAGRVRAVTGADADAV